MRSGGVTGKAAGRPRSAVAAARTYGFTILEITLVIGIMSILMALAIAASMDYTKRTRMVEVMLAAGTCRTPVFEAYYYGRKPEPGGWGCETSTGWGKMVQSIEVGEHGKVTVIAKGFGDDDIDGKALTLMPLVEGAPAQLPEHKGKGLEWRCGDPDDGTTIKVDFLPASCRSGGS